MSKQTEALKLALEALEVCQQSNYGRDWVWPDTAHPTAMANVKEAITAIREALAEWPAHESAYQRGYMDGIAKGLRMEQPAQQQAYEKENPLGGPAKVFQAMANAIRAGDSYHTVLRQYGYAEAQQQSVPDALHFAQWTAAKKDLSDYILVGSLSLAGIEDGEYGTSEIDPLDNTIDALQEKLVTGPDHKKVPLLAYIGALNNTSQQPAQPSKPKNVMQVKRISDQSVELVFTSCAAASEFIIAHGIKGDA